MTEGTQARPTQRLRSQQSVSASIKLYHSFSNTLNLLSQSTHYPETQEMQSFLKESNGTDTDDPTMPNFNDLILVNTKIRAQSSMRRDKSQSYEKQVAVIKERTLLALRSSSKEFRALQAENLRCSPPEKKPTFDGRVVNNEAADSLFVYDKTWIKARYKQPLLVPKIPQNYNRRYSNGISWEEWHWEKNSRKARESTICCWALRRIYRPLINYITPIVYGNFGVLNRLLCSFSFIC